MVNVVSYPPTGRLMAQVLRLGPKVGRHLALFLHSSHEPGELSQCSTHDDSTIKIIVVIIIIIIGHDASANNSNLAQSDSAQKLKQGNILWKVANENTNKQALFCMVYES